MRRPKHERERLAYAAGGLAYYEKCHLLGCPYRREWLRVAWLRGVYSAAAEGGGA